MEDIFQQRPKTPIEEAWHTEQERKKYDIIRIKNPTNKDFYVMYDVNQFQKVPANATIDVPRYIAIRYITHMKDEIIHSRAQKMHDDFIAERRLKGLPDYKDKAIENAETYETAAYPKTTDQTLVASIIDELWVGLVYEFGRDKPPANMGQPQGNIDLRPMDMRILEKIDSRRVETPNLPIATVSAAPAPYVPQSVPQASPPAPSYGFSDMNQKLSEEEVTVHE